MATTGSQPWRDTALLLLSTAAGCVDAVGFLHVGVFPANMTGTTVIMALDIFHNFADILPRVYALLLEILDEP